MPPGCGGAGRVAPGGPVLHVKGMPFFSVAGVAGSTCPAQVGEVRERTKVRCLRWLRVYFSVFPHTTAVATGRDEEVLPGQL